MKYNRFGNYASLATAVPCFNWENRDNGSVRPTPSKGFRENNELYYDGAEGIVFKLGHVFLNTHKLSDWFNFHRLKYRVKCKFFFANQ